MATVSSKGLGFLLVAALGLTALFATSCGGKDNTVLALAIRLDGGSPALSAYAGDLVENTPELPAGRYYILSVTAQDVIIDFGEVEIEPGQEIAVFAIEDTTGGSLADPERAESLRTIANFLIDMELAKFAILESASGGFTVPLFDPAAQPDGDDLEELFAMEAAIAAQEEAVIDAVLQIEREAQVSLPVSYVHTGAVPAGGLLGDLLGTVHDFFNLFTTLPDRRRTRVLEIAANLDPIERGNVFDGMPANLRGDAASFDEWRREVERGEHDDATEAIRQYFETADPLAVVAAGHTTGATLVEEGVPLVTAGADFLLQTYGRVPHVSRVIEVTNKALEWEEYIKNMYLDPAGGAEQLLRDKYIGLLEERIVSDLRELAPHLSDSVLESLAGQLSNRVVSAAASLVNRPLPPADSTGLDTPWIDELIQDISDQLVADGESGIAIAVLTDDLRLCLTESVEDGLTREEAMSGCADILGPDTAWIDEGIQYLTDELIAQGVSDIDIAVFTDAVRQCLEAAVELGLDPEEAMVTCEDFLLESATPTPTPTPAEPTPTPEPTPAPLAGYYAIQLLSDSNKTLSVRTVESVESGELSNCDFLHGGLCEPDDPPAELRIVGGPFETAEEATEFLCAKMSDIHSPPLAAGLVADFEGETVSTEVGCSGQ